MGDCCPTCGSELITGGCYKCPRVIYTGHSLELCEEPPKVFKIPEFITVLVVDPFCIECEGTGRNFYGLMCGCIKSKVIQING